MKYNEEEKLGPIPCRVSFFPDRPALLLHAGEQQSEIKFTDTKQTLIILNRYVRPL
jgi:hypothetical protein